MFFQTFSSFGQIFNLRHDHSNLLVSDLDSSAQFYIEILQLRELETPWGENPKVRFFSIGENQQIHMVQVDSVEIIKNKIVHMAFNIEEFDAYLNYLNKKGIEYYNFNGLANIHQLRPDGVKQIYFQDPDGNWLEVNDAKY